ncbi:MAG: prolyl aminopeptidase [Rhodobacteraceae bacterium]|nr:prolyl aminopeptidase [Paracoccaceae bacterium]
MLEHASHKDEEPRHSLYPVGDAFHTQTLEVSGGHSIYIEESGREDGEPVVVLHGGPGGGCSPAMRRFFDPDRYRVILFDQRGCGRSTPYASVENNTTWDLVDDIEAIRETLGIPKWTVFGGSWGATLSLLYAQAHPMRVNALVLRGIFTMTQAELDWFYGGGAGQFWPEAWALFSNMVPAEERHDLIAAYRERLFGKIDAEVIRFSRAWAAWENTLATLDSKGHGGRVPGHYAKAFSLIENHYFTHKGFLRQDGQIFADMDKIRNIPGYIVQGRYDMICPPHTAHALHKLWPKSKLRLVKAGHAMSEPAIANELVGIMNEMD